LDTSDVVYEYPSNSAQGQGLADLLTELRRAFNTLKGKKKDSTPYVITVAVPAATKNHAHYKIPQMNSAIDYWNLMV
jgi:chitinase